MTKPPYSFTDDSEAWKAFKSGQESAFDYLYDTHFSGLYGYGTRLCPDKSLVKDSIQNLFVSLWRNRSRLSDVYSIKHYLYKCLRRSLIKEIVTEKKYFHPEEVSEEYYFEVTFSHERLLISEQVAQENTNRLQRAFQLLTKRQKEAVFLRFYESLEYSAIAEIMVLKEVKYARTLVYRALDVLKASIRRMATIE